MLLFYLLQKKLEKIVTFLSICIYTDAAQCVQNTQKNPKNNKKIMNYSGMNSISNTLYKIVLGLLTIPLLLSSCKQEDGAKFDLLPSAKGGRGEIILVMDSTKWQGELGQALRDVLTIPTPGLPRPQSLFTVRYIKPHLFAGLLKQHHNIITVTTFDLNTYGSNLLQSYFTPESKQMVLNGERFQQVKRDEFAKGQVVYRLFGAEDAPLREHIRTNAQNIRDFFNQEERNRVRADLLSIKGNEGIEKNLEDAHGFAMHVPIGYRIAKDTAGFIWLRHPEAKIDRNLFVAYQPYTNQAQFETENLIAWRDSIAFQHIYGDPDNSNSFVVTERLDPVIARQFDRNGQYVVELRGRWKTNNISMGGPFLSYVFLDKTQKRMFYIEGFLFSPSVKQREIMREFEVVLNTFEG